MTSAAMVAAFYGIKTDPQQLNAFLTRKDGFTSDGLIHWNRVPLIAPAHLALAYNGGPSYELIDSNLLAGNPDIALIRLPEGGYHFVVIVGRRNYSVKHLVPAIRENPSTLLSSEETSPGLLQTPFPNPVDGRFTGPQASS